MRCGALIRALALIAVDFPHFARHRHGRPPRQRRPHHAAEPASRCTTAIRRGLAKMANGVTPIIDLVVPRADFSCGLARLETRRVFGKIIATV